MKTDVSAKNILVVEDNLDDVFFMRRVLKKAGLENEVTMVADGEQAIACLKEQIQKNTLPRLMILDINLPRVSGLELIRWTKAQPELASLIITVVTSSADDRDVQRAYDAGAHAYLLKYPTSEDLLKLVNAVDAAQHGGALDFPGLKPG